MGAAGGEWGSEEEGEKDDDVRDGRGDEDLEEEIEEDPEEEEFEEDPEEEEFEEEGEDEKVGEVAGGGETEEEEEEEDDEDVSEKGGGGDEEADAEEAREVAGDEESEEVEEEEELEDDEDLSEKAQGSDEEEEEEVEGEEYEDVNEVEEFEGDVDEVLQGEGKEEEDEEDEDVAEDNEEAGDDEEEDDSVAENNEEEVKGGKQSTPLIAFMKDATGFSHLNVFGKSHNPKSTAEGSPHESQIGYSTETGGPDDEAEDTENTKPLIFAETGALKNENVECASKEKGPKERGSDFGEKERSLHINEKDARIIYFRGLRSEAKGFETTELLMSDSLISVEAGAIENEKVDCASEGKAVKKMEFDCEGKKRGQPINKKDVKDDAYGPCSESKGTEIAKPFSTSGTEMVTCENSELVGIQEGGVEDMELDSEENIVQGSDAHGTVVDSIQGTLPLDNHHAVSFTAGADALNNRTCFAESLKSLSAQGTDTMLSHDLKQDDGRKYMNLDLEYAMSKTSSLVATSRKQRSLSPCTQLMDRNKRPAIICDYYAKGWCIRGNSCRFLHVKENKENNSKQQQGRDLSSAHGENQIGEGVGDDNKNMLTEQHAESQSRQLNDKLGYSSLDSQLLHSVKPDFSRGLGASSSAFTSRLRPSSNMNVTEGIDYRRSQNLFNDPLQSIANRYIKQHLHPSPATGMYSSRYISHVNGTSNFVSSLNSSPFDSHKILSGSIDFITSSMSLGSRPQRDPLNSLGLTMKAEVYKWEPSRPFRPSYYFSIPSMSSPGSMYDPLRDSIEQSSLGIGSYRAELIHYPSHQRYPDSASAGIHFGMDEYSGTMLDRNGHSRVTGLPVTEAEAAESSVADQGNIGSAPEEANGSGTNRRLELSETNKTNASSAEKKNKLIEEKIHSNGMDIDRGLDEDEQRESKTQFRAALIDFIKERLKPAWREGNLSKDAHNLIVKKAAKKVLSSLHNHQVPSTPELVQQYLSASQPKITKLVEAYVQKHSNT